MSSTTARLAVRSRVGLCLLAVGVLASACGEDEPESLPGFADFDTGEAPEWRCVDQALIAGIDAPPSWVVPESIGGAVTVWTVLGADRDATIRPEQDSGPEHEGPCATAEGDVIGLALAMGGLVEGESESHLFIGMSDGPRSYDIASELAEAPPLALEVACSIHDGGIMPSSPASGTVEVLSMPGSEGSPLRIVASAEGDCSFDFDLQLTFPSALYED
jgi:hypothetical protein